MSEAYSDQLQKAIENGEFRLVMMPLVVAFIKKQEEEITLLKKLLKGE